MVVKKGSRIHTRPGTPPRQNVQIIETDPTNDIENILNRAEHIKALGGQVSNVWGSPIMKDAGRQRKDRYAQPDCPKKEAKAEAVGIQQIAMDIVKNGMPEDTEQAAQLTKLFGPGGIARLLQIRKRHALGEI